MRPHIRGLSPLTTSALLDHLYRPSLYGDAGGDPDPAFHIPDRLAAAGVGAAEGVAAYALAARSRTFRFNMPAASV